MFILNMLLAVGVIVQNLISEGKRQWLWVISTRNTQFIRTQGWTISHILLAQSPQWGHLQSRVGLVWTRSHYWLWQVGGHVPSNGSYIIPNFVRLRGTIKCSLTSLTVHPSLTQQFDFLFSLLVLASSSTVTALYSQSSQNPLWPTCCTLAGQRRGHWSTGLSLELQ